MHIKELLLPQTIGAATEESRLECLLAAAFDGYVRHFAPASGDARSVRVFSAAPFTGSVPMPRDMSPKEMARELMRLTREEARYPENRELGRQKGWEVAVVNFEDRLLPAAWAVWI